MARHRRHIGDPRCQDCGHPLFSIPPPMRFRDPLPPPDDMTDLLWGAAVGSALGAALGVIFVKDPGIIRSSLRDLGKLASSILAASGVNLDDILGGAAAPPVPDADFAPPRPRRTRKPTPRRGHPMPPIPQPGV